MEIKRQLEISKLNLILSTLYPVRDKYHFQFRYFTIIVNALFLEEKYQADVTAANKEILKYLDLPTLKEVEPILDLFTELYDTHHKVRFAIETLDSVESIRLELKDKPELLFADWKPSGKGKKK